MSNTDNKEFNPDLVSVVDENGETHVFEELDRIETDEGRFIALLPVYEDAEEILDDDGELIILQVVEDEDGETYLEPIEDDALFNAIGKIFEERLEDVFEFDGE
jgi:uncharacterized protein YrzB (UPF0473 family)